MRNTFCAVSPLLALVFAALGCMAPISEPQPRDEAVLSGEVTVNGTPLSPVQSAELERVYGQKPTSGRYWYDPISGLWGLWGREAHGVLYPGHDFGRLPEEASAGAGFVWVNGRRLPDAEVLRIAAIFGDCRPGRYWLDGRTWNYGMEGYAVPLGNVMAAASGSPSHPGPGGVDGGVGGGLVWCGQSQAGGGYSGASSEGGVLVFTNYK